MLVALLRWLLSELRVTTAADLLLVDLVVLSCYHQLRINGWGGPPAQLLKTECFGLEGTHAKLRR